MDIKKLNDLIPSDLKVKIKEFAEKFNTVPAPVAPVAAPAAPAPAATFGEGKLQDGVTVVKWNTPELGVGSIVTVVTPEGEIQAPEGEHILSDGTKLKVDAQGVVTELEAPQSEMANVLNQITGFSKQVSEFEADKKLFRAEVEAFKKETEERNKEFDNMKVQFGQFVKLMEEVFNTPSGNPIEPPKNKHPKNKIFSLAD